MNAIIPFQDHHVIEIYTDRSNNVTKQFSVRDISVFKKLEEVIKVRPTSEKHMIMCVRVDSPELGTLYYFFNPSKVTYLFGTVVRDVNNAVHHMFTMAYDGRDIAVYDRFNFRKLTEELIRHSMSPVSSGPLDIFHTVDDLSNEGVSAYFTYRLSSINMICPLFGRKPTPHTPAKIEGHIIVCKGKRVDVSSVHLVSDVIDKLSHAVNEGVDTPLRGLCDTDVNAFAVLDISKVMMVYISEEQCIFDVHTENTYSVLQTHGVVGVGSKRNARTAAVKLEEFVIAKNERKRLAKRKMEIEGEQGEQDGANKRLKEDSDKK